MIMPERRRALRMRLADYAAYLREHGTMSRADMARIGEISTAHATSDMRALIEDYPDLGIVYDTNRKIFVAKGVHIFHHPV